MNKFNDINTNIDLIRLWTKRGYISTSILNHYFIYSKYDYYRKLDNYVGVSVLYTSEDCKVSQSLVFKVIKEMEEAI